MQNLNDYIREAKRPTEEQLTELIKLIGGRCKANTRDKLKAALSEPCALSKYGIYSRIQLEPEVRYIAGQDMTSELRVVRDLLLPY